MYTAHPLRQLTKSPDFKVISGEALDTHTYVDITFFSTAVAMHIVIIKEVSFVSGVCVNLYTYDQI